MITFSRLCRKYEDLCEEKDIPAETVMAYLVELSQRERYDLYACFDDEVPQALADEFTQGMDRILAGEPMGHVLGYSWFYGYKFIVNPDVLIPRYETEELCANVLTNIDACFPDYDTISCVDVGTGSGAIAITLVKEEPKIRMTATDISEEALSTARKNAEINDAPVEFIAGDMLKPLIDRGIKLDVLVCNPPYIPSEEVMEHSVVDFEPHVALFGGNDGLKFYRDVFRNCRSVMKERSFMAFEMGWDQKERLTGLVREMLPEAVYTVLQDINGEDRMLFVYFRLEPVEMKGTFYE